VGRQFAQSAWEFSFSAPSVGRLLDRSVDTIMTKFSKS
jgi:hypothetical protein